MITGGIVIGSNGLYDLKVGANPVQDVFYKNITIYQSLLTHWGQVEYTTWLSNGNYTWRSWQFVQNQTYEQTLETNNNFVGNIVVGTTFL
jgi:hypothetical protein